MTSTVAQLPTFSRNGYAVVDFEQQCSLCNDKNTVDVIANPCLHGFHSSCIQRIEDQPQSCPLCDSLLDAPKYITRVAEECAILCSRELNDESTCLTLCGHVFHNSEEDCLPQWLNRHPQKPTCPSCRYDLPVVDRPWRFIRNYISYEQQENLVKTITALGVILGAWTSILGACVFSTNLIAVGGVMALSVLLLDSIHRNNFSDIILSGGLLVSLIALISQAYLLAIGTFVLTVYLQN